jgi:F-type H+-transporting ATPase subunit epsilon
VSIALHIITPEGTVVEKGVSAVTLPGIQGPFMVLKDHAALITALEKGDIVYRADEKEERLSIAEGFVEVRDNKVVCCVEL